METPALLSLRPLPELLRRLWERSLEGDVFVRERDGSRHRITVRPGRVVAVRVAGLFDPLLDGLRRRGVLSADGHGQVLEALGRSDRPSGQLAVEMTELTSAQLREALERQTRIRFDAVVDRAREHGRDAWFVPRRVPAREQAGSISLAFLLGRASARRPRIAAPRHRSPAAPPPAQVATRDIAVDRRALRRLALALHPDRNGHLDPETRATLARRLAAATARHHGLD